MFSSRLPARLEPTPLSLAISAARRDRSDLVDLTETNPTAVGLTYPPALLSLLASPQVLAYRPDPLGLPEAREAIASAIGSPVPAGQMVLTSSTSEAYGWLFKLLCDPGDDVLVPAPSYPLFELLTGLESVRTRPYRLDPHIGWGIDRSSVEEALTKRTRAVLVVSPNNPTGSFLRDDDREWLVSLAADRQVALIADEVFYDYRLQSGTPSQSLSGESRAMTFTLGGLSKSVGLPQLKLAWMLVSGPGHRLREAMTRLEIIADTYLSVSTPVQVAAPALLEAGAAVREQIRERISVNLARLGAAARRSPTLTVMEPEGGWSAVIRVPAVESEDAMVLRVLKEAGVLVHPGYFFDFTDGRFVVVSLLPPPDEFEAGVARLFATLSEVVGG